MLIDAQDLVQVVERFDLLQHHRHQGLGVGTPRILGRVLAEDRAPTAPAAMAQRGVLGVLHRCLGFRGGVDVRYLHAARATIQGAGDRRRVVAIDAHHRAVARHFGRADHMLDVLPAARAVLAVEEHAVEAEMPEELDQTG